MVLLATVSLDRIGLPFLLIVAFSAGLAGVLALVSLILAYTRQLLAWLRSRRWQLRRHPYIGWAFGKVNPAGPLTAVGRL
ncbi:MAG: hypothetical protein V3S55_15035, partial [Nitrospiraceae bacterium]